MKKLLKVATDLFQIPYKDEKYILYAPRIGFACICNQALIELINNSDLLNESSLNKEETEILNYLDSMGIFDNSKEAACIYQPSREYLPTMVTIFPTNQCNLACKYCYASAGDQNPLVMDWHIAISSIDQVIKNVKLKNMSQMSLGFHGGGEPLLPWHFVQQVLNYAKEQCTKEDINLSCFAATNGILNQDQLDWCIQHFSSLNISFDGLPEIQNLHRPFPNGEGSFSRVDKTMRYLDAHEFPYGIRSTISSKSIDYMEDMIQYIATNYKTKSIHFEPLFNCGRCKTNQDLVPDLNIFSKAFQTCELKAAEYNVMLTYSGCKTESLTNSFCGVTRDNFAITPDGYVTTCYEVTSSDDPRADRFIIGKINDDGGLEIDYERRDFLNTLTVENLEFCRDCIAKWHCAGDCLAKVDQVNIASKRGHERCQINRELTKNRIVNLLEGTLSNSMIKKQKKVLNKE